MKNNFKFIAVLTCIILLFSLPSYAATKHKKVIHKNKTPIVNKVSNPPITFDLSAFISVKKTDDEYNEYTDFEVRNTRIELNSIGTPELKLVAQNYTNKDIISFEFTCTFTDSFNRPIYKVGTKNKVFKGISQNIRLYGRNKRIKDFTVYDETINYYLNRYQSLIDSGSRTEQDIRNLAQGTLDEGQLSLSNGEYSFNLVLYNTSTNVSSIKLTKVKFSDGTEWKS